MSWFPGPAAFVAFSAFLGLLLVLVVLAYRRLTVPTAKAQVGVSAGAELCPGRQGGGSAGAREQPQGWAGGPLPGTGGRFPAMPWPGSGVLPVPSRRRERSPLTHCLPCLGRKGDQRSSHAEATRRTPEVSEPWARAGVLQRPSLAPCSYGPVCGGPISSFCILCLWPLTPCDPHSPGGCGRWSRPRWYPSGIPPPREVPLTLPSAPLQLSRTPGDGWHV